MKKVIITENQLKMISEKIQKEEREIYFGTFSGAVQYARECVEKTGIYYR